MAAAAYQEGDSAVKTGNWHRAIDALGRSYALIRYPTTAYYLSYVYVQNQSPRLAKEFAARALGGDPPLPPTYQDQARDIIAWAEAAIHDPYYIDVKADESGSPRPSAPLQPLPHVSAPARTDLAKVEHFARPGPRRFEEHAYAEYEVASDLPGGKVLTLTPATPYAIVLQALSSGAPEQRWQLQPLGGSDAGYFHIVSVSTQLCLNVLGSSQDDGGRLIGYACQANYDNDKWALQTDSAGSYFIRAKHSDKVVDVNASDTATGLALQQWTFHGGANQRWSLLLVRSR
jgi:hypothetical protein